jgi:hypothetical protein
MATDTFGVLKSVMTFSQYVGFEVLTTVTYFWVVPHLKVEAVDSSETLVHIYQTARRNVLEESNIHCLFLVTLLRLQWHVSYVSSL